MKKYLIYLITGLAGFFLYFGWAGFVEQELSTETFQGTIVKKIESHTVTEKGMNLITEPLYYVTLSSGEKVPLTHSLYRSIQIGDQATFIKRENQIVMTRIKQKE